MRSFKGYRRLIMHVLILLMIIVSSIYLKKILFRANYSNRYVLPAHTSVYITGDSHARDAFDPSIIAHSVNHSQSSEDIPYSYYKVKKVLEDNAEIKTIIVSSSYHYTTYPLHSRSAEMMKRYHSLLDKEFYKTMFSQQGVRIGYLLRYTRDFLGLSMGVSNDLVEYLNFEYNNRERYPYQGAYEGKNESHIGNTKKLDAAIKLHYGYSENDVRRSDEWLAHYVTKLKNICELHGVSLYFINTPVHEMYYARIPPHNIAMLDSIAHNAENDRVHYLNLSAMNLQDRMFRDYQHVNTLGAQEVSEYVQEILTRDQSKPGYSQSN